MCRGAAESVNLYNNMLLTSLLINVSYYYGSNENDSSFYFGQVIGDIAQCEPLSMLWAQSPLPARRASLLY